MTIVNYWLNNLIMTKYPNTFQNPKFHEQKTMANVWWSVIGIVYYSFLESNKCITVELYHLHLDEMHVYLSQMWPVLVNWRGSILLHDNVQPHVARMTSEKLSKMGYKTFPHSLYSLDFSQPFFQASRLSSFTPNNIPF